MRALKAIALATLVTRSLTGIAVGSPAAKQPDATVVADSGDQRGDLDARSDLPPHAWPTARETGRSTQPQHESSQARPRAAVRSAALGRSCG